MRSSMCIFFWNSTSLLAWPLSAAVTTSSAFAYSPHSVSSRAKSSHTCALPGISTAIFTKLTRAALKRHLFFSTMASSILRFTSSSLRRVTYGRSQGLAFTSMLFSRRMRT